MVEEPRVALEVEGRPSRAFAGAPLLRALASSGLPTLQRSIRYHRPRAPFCGVGQCTQCLVRVNGVPNVRACRYVPRPGDRVSFENAWPSTRHDLLGVLDLLFRHGLDTAHGFRRPAVARPIYQRIIRRLAGYGRLPDAAPAPLSFPGEALDTDVLVVGGGTSGRAAAEILAHAGVDVTVVDRALDAPAVTGTRSFAASTAVFLPPPRPPRSRPFTALVAREGRGGLNVRARRVVLAPGGYDAGLWFAGSDRPGVMTADGAVALFGTRSDPDFRHAAVVGSGPRAAELLDRWGERIDAVIATGTIPPEVTRRASSLDIPLYPRTLLLAALGRSRVRGVELAARGGGGAFRVTADAVLLAHRRLPNAQLFFQAGARMIWRAEGGAYYPDVDATGATSVPGLFAVGAASATLDPAGAQHSGERAARALTGTGTDGPAPPRLDPDRPGEMEGYYRELLARPRARARKWIACACEDVLLDEIEEASRLGYRGIEVIKRYTSLGTGLCQGRYCLPDTLLLLARLEERSPREVGYITQRPPVVPTSLGALAALPDDATEEGA
ncbi:MAG: 2Fe-2S iron-sulfur cluster-binding protein [Thermoplasmata archaeon]